MKDWKMVFNVTPAETKEVEWGRREASSGQGALCDEGGEW